MTRHVVQFSTGAGSAEVAWRVVEQYGSDNVTLLTADTMVEDKDNWRFATDVVDRLCCEWVRLADGRTPMQVGRDHRAVPNNRARLRLQPHYLDSQPPFKYVKFTRVPA